MALDMDKLNVFVGHHRVQKKPGFCTGLLGVVRAHHSMWEVTQWPI
jgi:hypothetical protein